MQSHTGAGLPSGHAALAGGVQSIACTSPSLQPSSVSTESVYDATSELTARILNI